MFWNFNFGSFFSSFNSHVRNLVETIKAQNDGGQPEKAASPNEINGSHGDDKLSGGDGKDNLIGGTGHDWMRGGDGEDIINGGAGRDRIFGHDGADTLYGGAGEDTMAGGAGSDTFIYADVSKRGDTITDFATSGQLDALDLSQLIANLGYAGGDVFGDGLVQLTQSGADTLVQIDNDGAGGASSPQTLVTLQNVTANDVDTGVWVV